VVVPVGGKPVPCDVRVIAATHRAPPELIAGGTFREDLYYRLNVVPVAPLRDRRSDTLALAAHFLRQAAGQNAVKELTDAAVVKLRDHNWPGNVRELRNVIERANVLIRGNIVDAGDLDLMIDGERLFPEDLLEGNLPTAVARLEQAMIQFKELGGVRRQSCRSRAAAQHQLAAALR
jgi:DNA-binding NtrC family response regulator